MKVYIVFGCDYDGSSVVGVFDDKQRVESYRDAIESKARRLNEEYNNLTCEDDVRGEEQ